MSLSPTARTLLASFDPPTICAAYRIALRQATEAAKRAVEASSEAAALAERVADLRRQGVQDDELAKLARRAGAAADFLAAFAAELRRPLDALEQAVAWITYGPAA